jgi:hypothetical protein
MEELKVNIQNHLEEYKGNTKNCEETETTKWTERTL